MCITVSIDKQFLRIGGSEFALDGMLNIHASGIKYRKPKVTLRSAMFHAHLWERCYALEMAYTLVTQKLHVGYERSMYPITTLL